MSTATRQYDGDLAVATLVLSVLLTGTQIGFVADGMMMITGQGWFLSLLFAIVIATGLLHSQFVSHRLWAKIMPRHYAWLFGALTATITGMMAIWGMTRLSDPWTYKWYLGAFLGALVPLQTMLLANMTSEMFLLAGDSWFAGSYTQKIVAVVRGQRQKRDTSVEDANPLEMASADAATALGAPASVAQPKVIIAEVLPDSVSPVLTVDGAPPQALPLQEELAQSIDTTGDHPSNDTDVHTVESSAAIDQSPAQVEPVSTPVAVTQKPAWQEKLPVHTPSITVDTPSARLSVAGNQVVIKVSGELSKRKWKDLHLELRRVNHINWSDASRAKGQDGPRERVLSGTISFPESKGKKNKKKRETQRTRHLEMLMQQLKEIVEQRN